MPSTFSTSALSDDIQFSFYGTFTTVTEPGTIYAGEINVLHADADGGSNLLIAQKSDLAQDAQIQSLSFYVTNAVGKLRLGVYSNGDDRPNALLAQTSEFTPVVGWNTVNVQTPTTLPAGTYWLAFLPEQNSLAFKTEGIPGLSTGRVYGYPFGQLPTTVSGQPVSVEYRFSFHATLNTGIMSGQSQSLSAAVQGGPANASSEFSVVTHPGTTDQPSIFQLTPGESGQIAYVISGDGKEQAGAIKVVFDVTGQRLQTWVYDVQKGWVLHGKDVSVRYLDADRFKVVFGANGVVEVYRNGKLLLKRSVTLPSGFE